MELVGQVRETGEVISVLLAGEAGAVFVDTFEFAVTLDLGIGIVHLQRSQQGDESRLLCRGTGAQAAFKAVIWQCYDVVVICLALTSPRTSPAPPLMVKD